MKKNDIDSAKFLFEKYNGDFFQMERDGVYKSYKSFAIPKEMEEEWLQRMSDEARHAFLHSENRKVIAESCARYCRFSVRLKDTSGIQTVVDEICRMKGLWDTNTLFRCINSVLSSVNIFADAQHKSDLISRCIFFLEELLAAEVTISNDYLENGYLPEYLSIESMQNRIDRTIQYWKKRQN